MFFKPSAFFLEWIKSELIKSQCVKFNPVLSDLNQSESSTNWYSKISIDYHLRLFFAKIQFKGPVNSIEIKKKTDKITALKICLAPWFSLNFFKIYRIPQYAKAGSE